MTAVAIILLFAALAVLCVRTDRPRGALALGLALLAGACWALSEVSS